jgi:FkbM family methyltransferase
VRVNYWVERRRRSLYIAFRRLVKAGEARRLGRRFPALRRLYFLATKWLRPGITEMGRFTIVFHREDVAVSHSLRSTGTYEPFELELIRILVRPGDHCVDVGANIGIHSLALATSCAPSGQVLALEPDPENASLCRRNLASNHISCVELLELAADDSEGARELFLNHSNRGDHRLYQPEGEGRSVFEVAAVRLDRLLAERGLVPAVIKIDVQGCESRVLAGASESLGGSGRLVVLTEFWSDGLTAAGSSPSRYCEQLDALGLDLYEIDELSPSLRKISPSRRELLEGPCETNLLGVRNLDDEALLALAVKVAQ